MQSRPVPSQRASVDTPDGSPFDRITQIVTHVFQVPTSLVSFIEPDGEIIKSAAGAPGLTGEMHRLPFSRSFCRQVAETGTPLLIRDADVYESGEHADLTSDRRAFLENHLTAYLGVPLHGPDGDILGTLCAIDDVPRDWTTDDADTLRELAELITNELRLRTTVVQLEREQEAHASTRSLTNTALDALRDIFFLVDTEGRVLRWNLRAVEILGYSPEEFETLGLEDFFTPEDQPRVLRGVEQVFAEGSAQVEASLRTKKGETIPYEFTGALILAPNGAPLGVCGIGRDVSDRNRLQRQLEENLHALEYANSQFSAVVESAPGVIYQCLYEPDGSLSFPFVSSGATEVTFDLERLTQSPKALAQIIHPSDVDSLWDAIKAGRDAMSLWSWEGRTLTRSGAVRWISAQSRPMPLEDGRTLWTGIILDVTELKEMEAALRLSEVRYRSLIEASPDIFFRFSRDGHYLDVQAADAEDLLVAKAEELMGRKLKEMIPASEATRWLGVIGRALDTQQLQRYEYDLQTMDGKTHTFEARIVPVAADEVQAIVRDISERRRYERGLVQAIEAAEDARARADEARAEAEEAARVKSALLANMSHEIRTPLTGILGFAEVIADEGGEELGQYARYIGASGRRLLHTLNSVLDLAQIEAGRFKLRPTEFDLGRVVCETVELLRPRAESQGLELRCPLPDEQIAALTDEAALARIVTNLVSNAVKFTHEGSVSVSLTPLPDDEVELRVKDTGVGINREFLPHLFAEFRQESEGEGRRFEGSGLGLSITRRLVHIMGGTIRVESEKGEGSTFIVRLPLFLPERPHAA